MTLDQRRSPVFLDTSALFDAIDRSSVHHVAAATFLQDLLRESRPLVTTDAVLTELHGLTLGRLGPRIALDAIDRLIASPRVGLTATGPSAIGEAVEFLRTRPGRRISLVDALSFGAMRDLGSTSAFTLDDDFAAEGFATLP